MQEALDLSFDRLLMMMMMMMIDFALTYQNVSELRNTAVLGYNVKKDILCHTRVLVLQRSIILRLTMKNELVPHNA